MNIDLQQVQLIFQRLLDGAISREQADRWAYAVIQEEERKTLQFDPPADKERIWRGVMYLYGVDSMVSPGAYLHSLEDIRTASRESLR